MEISASKKILWLCSPELLDPSTLGPPVAASPSGIALRGLFVVNSSVGREHYLESPLAWHGLGGGLTRRGSGGRGLAMPKCLRSCVLDVGVAKWRPLDSSGHRRVNGRLTGYGMAWHGSRGDQAQLCHCTSHLKILFEQLD